MIDTVNHPIAAHEDIRSRLLYVKQWPDLSKEPAMRVGDIARICALLSRKPTVGFFVSREVGIPAGDAEAILNQLHETGCVGIFRTSSDALKAAHSASVAVPAPHAEADASVPPASAPATSDASAMPSRESSYFKRLWKKLLAH